MSLEEREKKKKQKKSSLKFKNLPNIINNNIIKI